MEVGILISMLATFFKCWWHLLDVPDPKLYENMDVVAQNGQNRRQHSYHQHILSSTSVTIDMTGSKYNIIAIWMSHQTTVVNVVFRP